jgi:capsular exopolysaccharide synthesis family protein
VQFRGAAAWVRGLRQVLRTGSGLILTAAVGTALAATVHATQNPSYTATSRLLVRPVVPVDALKSVDSVDAEVVPPELNLEATTEAAMLGSSVVALRVARTLGLATPPEALSRSVAATALTGSVIEVRVSASDPRLAVDLANGFAGQYLAYRREAATRIISGLTRNLGMRASQLHARIEELDARLAPFDVVGSDRPMLDREAEVALLERDRLFVIMQGVDTREATLKTFESLHTNGGEVITRAAAPSRDPVPATAAAIGIALGTILGGALALLRHQFEWSGAARGDVERISGMRVLATVPRLTKRVRLHHGSRALKPVVLHQPDSPAANAYQLLYTLLAAQGLGRTLRRVLVVSVRHGELRSQATANLAITCAQAGLGSVAIAADARHAALETLLGVRNSDKGLADALRMGVSWIASLIATGTRNLLVLAPGRIDGETSDTLKGVRLLQIIDEASRMFDVVLVDAPPITDSSEIVMLAEDVDVVLLVVAASAVDQGALGDAGRMLELAAAPLRGVVLTDAEGSP